MPVNCPGISSKCHRQAVFEANGFSNGDSPFKVFTGGAHKLVKTRWCQIPALGEAKLHHFHSRVYYQTITTPRAKRITHCIPGTLLDTALDHALLTQSALSQDQLRHHCTFSVVSNSLVLSQSLTFATRSWSPNIFPECLCNRNSHGRNDDTTRASHDRQLGND